MYKISACFPPHSLIGSLVDFFVHKSVFPLHKSVRMFSLYTRVWECFPCTQECENVSLYTRVWEAFVCLICFNLDKDWVVEILFVIFIEQSLKMIDALHYRRTIVKFKFRFPMGILTPSVAMRSSSSLAHPLTWTEIKVINHAIWSAHLFIRLNNPHKEKD